ncbi:ABC transporter ATP-binding protein [Paenibacillus sp.]|uniref:ABC transporter ATP-binding protein n=1 Tax=Paenibacillus sp. TaxID=58172 RepID=UPI002830C76E|nr:ABC transporter ATP-binding protein [Paenibacillus sp.]MDR0267023.1 ABC transporter ATP-binding protein [Paenibacillus sp.]
MEIILQTKGLSKSYGDFKAVDSVDLSIHRGDIYGFLGQNGAGKTTTTRMMMGLVRPTKGDIELFGENVATCRRNLERIGSIIEFPGFYPNLSIVENLDIHRRLAGIQSKDSIDNVLHLTGIWDVRNRLARRLSLGMKQRLGIARALLPQPELLILDEPTNGLDPIGIKEIRQLILDLARMNKITILISSHILSEVEQLATRIGILHKGRLLEELELEKIQQKNQNYIEAKMVQTEKGLMLLEEKMHLNQFPVIEPGVVRIYEKLNETSSMIKLLVEHGVEVSEFSLIQANLEDYFVQVTGGKIDG